MITRIIVVVKGGLVKTIYSDSDSIEVDVLDLDSMEVETDKEALEHLEKLQRDVPQFKPIY